MITLVTQYLDTIVTANATPSVIILPIDHTSTSLVNDAPDPIYNQHCVAQGISAQRTYINGSVTEFYGKTMCVDDDLSAFRLG